MKSPAEIIQSASRLNAFIADDAVSEALGRLERRYYEEFRMADSSEKRVTAWAKANVLRDFTNELKITIDAGEVEVLKAAKTLGPKEK